MAGHSRDSTGRGTAATIAPACSTDSSATTTDPFAVSIDRTTADSRTLSPNGRARPSASRSLPPTTRWRSRDPSRWLDRANAANRRLTASGGSMNSVRTSRPITNRESAERPSAAMVSANVPCSYSSVGSSASSAASQRSQSPASDACKCIGTARPPASTSVACGSSTVDRSVTGRPRPAASPRTSV